MNIDKISVDELKELLKSNENIVIIDVRSRQEFLEEHIPGAINLVSEDIIKNSKSSFQQYLKKIIFIWKENIVVYCDRGGRSMYFTKYLIECGYYAVSLTGGFRAYSRQKLKLI